MAPRIIIDFPNSSGRPGRRLFHAPQRIVTTHQPADVTAALEVVQSDCEAGATAIGFMSYEAAPAFDAAFATYPAGAAPLLWFAIFEQEHVAPDATLTNVAQIDWQFDTTRGAHAEAIKRIREEIAAGTTYQVNFTVRMHGSFNEDAYAWYEALRRAQGVGYHCYIETDEWCVLSLSPELFFEIRGRDIDTRPMKGTRPRGRFTEEDDALADELRSSPKERAENLMIVDLMRNDVGRIAEAGAVRVTRLYDVERYPTVQQMTSTVEAKLRADVTFVDALAALFPPGSVTGAPKISTMRLINQLEPSPRGIYCGALGIVERSGSVFNVPIRTIWLDRKTRRAEYGTGGGITADSAAESEFDELLTKTAVVTEVWPDFQLLETMRAHAGAVLRLDRHLQRLEESADYFGFEFCPETIARALREQLVHAPNDARVRLLLSEEGLVQVECAALDSLPANPTVAWARTPVQSGNRFLFHKTTHRAVYDAHARAAASSFDVLLFNERDEVTEFTRGNVVVQLAGKLLTPARESGLLAGVFRNELLAAGVVAEAVVPKSAIAHAARMWFVNSVREWVEVRLV